MAKDTYGSGPSARYLTMSANGTRRTRQSVRSMSVIGANNRPNFDAAILGASVLRMVALGPLVTAGALPMFWFLWVGVRVAHCVDRESECE